MTIKLACTKSDINQDGDFTPCDRRSFVGSSIYTLSYRSDPSFYDLNVSSKDPSPVQTARTRATLDVLDKILSTQANQLSALCEVWWSKFSSSPFVPSTPKEKAPVIRTRATSDALERILARESQQLTSVGSVWQFRFSSNPLKSSNDKGVENGMIKPSNRDDITSGEMVEDKCNQWNEELTERVFRWIDNLPESFDYTVEEIECLNFNFVF